MYSVQNKTVLITGGARGLGYKFAEILLRNGAKTVAIVDLPTSNGRNAVTTWETEFGKDRAVFFECDVAKVEDLKITFQKVVDAFKGLDIIINNAGILNEEHFEQMVDVNVNAVIHGSLLAIDHMGKHKGGKGGVIVNVSSILGLSTIPCLPIYTATKHAVLGFSQALSQSYNKTGVRVGIICPGVTDTALASLEHLLLKFTDTDPANNLGDRTVQSADHVALAVLDLIQKGENGAAWVVENRQSPYAVDFPHYSKRSLPVKY